MKTGNVTKKIIGGKLVRIDVAFDERIETVKITGDFFLHPEDTLEEIVGVLEGVLLPSSMRNWYKRWRLYWKRTMPSLLVPGQMILLRFLRRQWHAVQNDLIQIL